MQLEPPSITVKTESGYQKIFLHNIEYLEAQGKRVSIHLCSGKDYISPDSFHSIANMLLADSSFFKCHRSYVVSILGVEKFTSCEITTKSGQRLPIARGLGKAFSSAYFTAIFKE